MDDFTFGKHLGPGNHPNGTPQSVHGGGGTYPMGNVWDDRDPRTTGDYRYDSKPERRFTEMWQRQFINNRAIRRVQANILAGKEDIFDGVGTEAMYGHTWDGYTTDDRKKDLEGAARFMLDNLVRAPHSKEVLWRGTSVRKEVFRQLKPGAEFNIGSTSFSSDLQYANGYKDHSPGTSAASRHDVIFKLLPGAHALNLDRWSDFGSGASEDVVGGRFRDRKSVV